VIDGLEPYPAMKDSGVEWLGEVLPHAADAWYKANGVKIGYEISG